MGRGKAEGSILCFSGVHHWPIGVEDEAAVFTSWQTLIAHGVRRIYRIHGEPFDVVELVADGRRVVLRFSQIAARRARRWTL